MDLNAQDDFLVKKAYVEISTYRINTIKAIGDGVLIPTQIAKKSGIRTNHISKVLAELKRNGLCYCINENARKGRLYRLTDLGLRILECIE